MALGGLQGWILHDYQYDYQDFIDEKNEHHEKNEKQRLHGRRARSRSITRKRKSGAPANGKSSWRT